MKTKRPKAQRLTIAGKRVVVLEEADYEELTRKADEWEPPLPERNERGHWPLEVLGVIMARDILRARRKLGWSQAELARRAGIRPETLNRIEQGRNKPSVPTIAKIDRALKEAEAEGGA
jgi:ribosome-binding protein aMBF1 (putative translation factor)